MENAGQKYKRRNYFIKKEFQFKFIVKFCLIMLAGIVLSTCVVFLFSQDTLTSSFKDSSLVIESTGSAILPTILITNLITLAIITVAVIGVTLFISHRIAGPMFRFEKDIDRISQGDLRVRINLRKKDQFSAMAESFNSMASSLHEKIAGIDGEIDHILGSNETSAEGNKEKIKELKLLIQKNFSI